MGGFVINFEALEAEVKTYKKISDTIKSHTKPKAASKAKAKAKAKK